MASTRSKLFTGLGWAVVVTLCVAIILELDGPSDERTGEVVVAPREPDGGSLPAGLPLPPTRSGAPVVASRLLDVGHETAPALERAGVPVQFTGRVVDESGGPVAGATVRYLPHGRTLAAWGLGDLSDVTVMQAGFDAVPAVVTGADGRFAITSRHVPWSAREQYVGARGREIPARLFVTHRGFVPSSDRIDDFEGGQRDAGDIPLVAGAELTGRVVTAERRPIAGVAVRRRGQAVTRVEDSPDDRAHPLDMGREFVLGQSVTAADGGFSIRVAPGHSRLSFEATGYLSADVRSPEVGPGETHALGSVVLSRGRGLRGQVINGAGAPIAGAMVYALEGPAAQRAARRDDREWFGLKLARKQGGVATDADGRFEVHGLKRAKVDVVVESLGYEPRWLSNVHTHEDLADVSEVVGLRATGSLLIRVADRSDGHPLPTATVRAWRRLTTGGLATTAELPVFAMSPGVFRVVGVGPRGIEVDVEADGYAARRVRLDGAARGETERHIVRLVPESRLSGRVLGSDGVPIEGATLWLSPPLQRGIQLPKPFRVTTDADGRFEFANLRRGEWTLTAWATGWLRTGPRPVPLPKGEVVVLGDIVLDRGATIRGTVSDASGRPLPELQLTAAAPATSRHPPGVGVKLGAPDPVVLAFTQTDEDGRFAFVELVPGEVSLGGTGLLSSPIRVGSGDDVEVHLFQHRPAVVTGRVESDAGPLVGAMVQLLEGSLRVDSTRTDEYGFYRLEAFPGGSFEVDVQDADGRRIREAVEVEVDEEKSVDLWLGFHRESGR